MADLFAVLPKGEFVKKITEKKTKVCKYSEKCPHLATLDFMKRLDAYRYFKLQKYTDEWEIVKKEYDELLKSEPPIVRENAKRINKLWKELEGISYSQSPYGKKANVLQKWMEKEFCKVNVKHELCPTYQFIEKRKYV